jgi:hypothetical protein
VAGIVFHPGHHELHGVTVILETTRGVTYVGRFDTRDDRGVHLLNVSIHDAHAGGPSLEEFLARVRKYGVRAERKHLLVPHPEVKTVRRLGAEG